MHINEGIRAEKVRVIDETKGNLGVLDTHEAIRLAREAGLDLIEISPDADPPVAKIMDYGKFQYDQNKKQKEIKARATVSEVKSIQIKIGTGDNDLLMKARKADEWLKENHRVKAELYLKGRSKGMEKAFLEGRLNRLLSLITEPHQIVEGFRGSPKGIELIIERKK